MVLNIQVIHQNSLEMKLKQSITHTINLPEYTSIVENVNKTYEDDGNIDSKIISRILQAIENNLLEIYIEFLNSKKLIINTNIALIFDGFQVLKNKAINQEL